MQKIDISPVTSDRHFGEIARLISSQEDDPTTEAALKQDFEASRDLYIRMAVAEDGHGQLMGFYWAWRSRAEPKRGSFHLVVKPEHRRQGVGRALFDDMLQAVAGAHAGRIRTSVLEGSPESRGFAERRGFSEIRHQIGMELDLQAFDDRPYQSILEQLQNEGFCFSTMAELEDTEAARRRLYALNDTASASTPGQAGEHAWASFEDFQQSVCRSDWYNPAGQIIAIDTHTGNWAGMSAITRRPGQEYAYNLFTGVDLPYRGRKLGQAVKVLALRYARNALDVQIVRTHHNTRNLPMIAIDTKFGYRLVSGAYLMEKSLESSSA